MNFPAASIEMDVARPTGLLGLRHVALYVADGSYDATLDFYTRLVGMAVEWHPDADNAYLCSGNDNLALHRRRGEAPSGALDHIGFALACATDVDRWHDHLREAGVPIDKPPATHRDGARSFYCRAPDGILVQFIHHVPLGASPDSSATRVDALV